MSLHQRCPASVCFFRLILWCHAQLRSRSFVTLYLGMLVDIILFVLFALSVTLIYSLMMINVQVAAVSLGAVLLAGCWLGSQT